MLHERVGESGAPFGERVEMAKQTLGKYKNVEIRGYSGLTVEYARENGHKVIIRGLRAVSDFEYEFQMAQMNRHLSGIVTLFVATKAEYGYLSSSLVKQVAGLGGAIDKLVPPIVAAAIEERVGNDG